jgi:UPF0755 protein
MKKLKVLLLLLLLIPLGVGGSFFYLNIPPAPSGGAGERAGLPGAMFRVERGETLNSIAGRLESQRLIRSAFFLKLLSQARGSESAFKSGYFRIPPGTSAVDIHNLLVGGQQDQVRVTIPEGWTVGKIAWRLEELGVTPRAEFLAAAASADLPARYGIPARSLEGYLFPDTYFFPRGFPAEAAIQQMVENFFGQLDAIAPEYRSLSPRMLHDKVILASIVEREYRIAEEAPQIASVFYNRMRYKIGLESCATLEYIITEILGRPHPDYITTEDKEIDSSYNTYKWAGLPPGPISSPGLVALDAVFHPAETDFFYFVLQDAAAGKHFFSQRLSEHNEAKTIYLKK